MTSRSRKPTIEWLSCTTQTKLEGKQPKSLRRFRARTRCSATLVNVDSGKRLEVATRAMMTLVGIVAVPATAAVLTRIRMMDLAILGKGDLIMNIIVRSILGEWLNF